MGSVPGPAGLPPVAGYGRRRCLGLLAGGVLGLAAGCGRLGGAASRRPRLGSAPLGTARVGLLQFVRAAAPDAVRLGLLEVLAAAGYRPGAGLALEQRFAGGSTATAREQVQELLRRPLDLLVAIGTPPLEAALALAPASLPVVFAYCSNPWGAGAGSSYGQHRPNVTGTVGTNPLAAQLDLAQRLDPGLLRVGLVMNPAEPNSSFETELLRRDAEERDLQLLVEPVAEPDEVAAAAQRLLELQEVGALVRVGDYASSLAFADLAAAGLRHRCPVYSVDPVDIGVRGCMAVVGWDAHADGQLAGALAVQVLRGADPANLPFEPLSRRLLLLNRRTAAALGLAFPAELLRRADRVVG